MLVRSVYRFHLYFHVQLILHELSISLPREDGISKVKNAYMSSGYYSICDDYGVDANETWMHGDWFYTTDHRTFGHEVKAGLQKGLYQTILRHGSSHSLKVLQERVLNK